MLDFFLSKHNELTDFVAILGMEKLFLFRIAKGWG